MSEENKAAPDLVSILDKAFAHYDRNQDHVLSQTEIDLAVIDSDLNSEAVAAIAILKAGFAELKELHKEGWFFPKKGLSLADLLAFEELLSIHKEGALKGPQEELRLLTLRISERVKDLRHLSKLPYASENPLKSICPQAVRQGLVGDCYFLAALASVAATNPQIISHMIKNPLNEDGSNPSIYQVGFPGDPDNILSVPAPTLVELALYAQSSQYGTWPAILEKAYGVYLAQEKVARNLIPAENTDKAAHAYEALDLLTGQFGQWEYIELMSEQELANLIAKAWREKRAMVAGSKGGSQGITEDAGIPANHAYSLVHFDERGLLLSLRNPWGGMPPVESGRIMSKPVHDQGNGSFLMNIEQFKLNFIAVYYEIWTPSGEYDDWSGSSNSDENQLFMGRP